MEKGKPKQADQKEEGGYTGKRFAQQVTHKSFKGKRNSVGAKINNFRGERSLAKMKSTMKK